MSSRAEALAAIVAAGRRLCELRILLSTEGNLSVRLPDGAIATTPSGAHKGRLDPSDLVIVEPGRQPAGGRRASSEIAMHLAIYEERPDVHAVVHAHPTAATGYAVAGVALPAAALAESLFALGCVPIAPYGTPSTRELADAVREPARRFDAMLLANHGAVTTGGTLEQATERMVQLEHLAQIALVSHLLGGASSLSAAQIDALSLLRQEAGGDPIPAACYPSTGESGTITLTRDQLVGLIVEALERIR